MINCNGSRIRAKQMEIISVLRCDSNVSLTDKSVGYLKYKSNALETKSNKKY